MRETSVYELRERIKTAANTLIQEVGADRPMDIEEVADRAVDVIRGLQDRIQALEADVENYACEFNIDLSPEPGTDLAKVLHAAKRARERAADVEDENLKLLAEIDEWKFASGLKRGGDPDQVRPSDVSEYIAVLEAVKRGRDKFVENAQRSAYVSAIAVCHLVLKGYREKVSAENRSAEERARGAEACIEAIKESIPVGYAGRKISWVKASAPGQYTLLEAYPEHPKKPFLSVEVMKASHNGMPFVVATLARDVSGQRHVIAEFDVPYDSNFNYVDCQFCPEEGVCTHCLGTRKDLVEQAIRILTWVYNQWIAQTPIVFGHKTGSSDDSD